MLTNKELYGREMPPIPETVCEFRIQVLKKRLSELLEVHFMEQDIALIKEVEKAIRFWTKLGNGEENEIYS